MTILIVDDDANCRELWGRMLHGLADKILFADTLEEAFVQMGTIPPPDLILLDLKLPPYGAEYTLTAINAFREYNPKLVVIAISGMTLDEIMESARKAGVVLQAAVSKSDQQCQANLMAAVQKLLADSKGFKDSLAVLETVHDAIEKKRTDKIRLPE